MLAVTRSQDPSALSGRLPGWFKGPGFREHLTMGLLCLTGKTNSGPDDYLLKYFLFLEERVPGVPSLSKFMSKSVVSDK